MNINETQKMLSLSSLAPLCSDDRDNSDDKE